LASSFFWTVDNSMSSGKWRRPSSLSSRVLRPRVNGMYSSINC
jgi:hypothetical protein